MLKIENTAAKSPRLAFQLFDILDQHEIDYCHWKSNELLAEGLIGKTDLDLLVERGSFQSMVALLLNCGFKQATVRWGPGTPGLLHFYAFDNDAEDFIHVHLHSHLPTGAGAVETHLLPCEAMLLKGCSRIGQVRVPSREAEAAVGLLRKFIKNGSLLHMLLRGRRHGRNERDELLFSPEEEAAAAAYQALDDCFRAIGRDLFMDCYRAFVEDAPAGRQWWLGLRVRRCLAGYRRQTAGGWLGAYAGLVAAKLRRVARGNIKNKVLDSGGAVIAFIGGDATGKSTLVSESSQWLGSTFAVRTLHVGKPPCTCLTWPLFLLLPAARRLVPGQRHAAQQALGVRPHNAKRQESPPPPRSWLYAIRAVALAWDRSCLLRKAQRAAAAGEIVICDRYPSDLSGATDGPRLQVRAGQHSWRGRLFNWLARCEQRIYEQNPSPDLALRLQVSIETAKRRNRERTKSDRHSDEDLECRHQPCRAWRKTGTKVVHDIDTEQSLADTTLSVKQAIWESL